MFKQSRSSFFINIISFALTVPYNTQKFVLSYFFITILCKESTIIAALHLVFYFYLVLIVLCNVSRLDWIFFITVFPPDFFPDLQTASFIFSLHLNICNENDFRFTFPSHFKK